MPHQHLAKEFEDFARSAENPESVMQHVSQRVHMHIPRYNWVGFYLIKKADPSRLALGPHTGSFTPNAEISLEQGLCGSAASMGRTVVADNVAEDPRYIQASDMVKSQISAPVIVGGKTVAVLNVESYFLASFRPAAEREFVETCAKLVGQCFERTGALNLVQA